MALIINDTTVPVLGIRTISWKEAPGLRLLMGQDGRPRRTTWVRGIVLHTTKGIPGGKDQRPQKIWEGFGPSGRNAERIARFWSTDSAQAGAHLVVDHDGTVACLADLSTEVAFHAGKVNEVTIGIEIYQGSSAELYEGQLATVVKLVDFLTETFGIQRQIHAPYRGGPVPRMAAGGTDVVGVYGHRDVTDDRGLGDPGDAVFELLKGAGYEVWDFAAGQDLDAWKDRQRALGLAPDGVPGPKTVEALKTAGRPHGLWVQR